MTSQVLQTAWSQESWRTKANYFTGDYMNTSAHKHLYILHTFPDTCIYHAHRIECVICIAVLERLLFLCAHGYIVGPTGMLPYKK